MIPTAEMLGNRIRHQRSGLLRWLAVCVVIATSAAPQPGAAESVPRISPQELKQRIDSADLIVIDVRTSRSWTRSETKIAGAVREDPSWVDKWAHKYPKSKTLVFYCA
jgi:predicted sulfurtransferase